MHLFVPREAAPGERRVALTPHSLARLAELGHHVSVAARAGEDAGFPDADYREAGASPTEDEPWHGEVVVQVGPPPLDRAGELRPGAMVIGFLDPFVNGDLVNAIAAAGATALAFEALPRTTLAQSMDALSSQATAAGYAAVLEVAVRIPRFLPMLTTAAGTIRPAKVLVLGAGVAGLQAIATARRLGAVVSAYDIRPAAREQVESLGARFVEAPTGEADEHGYAKEADEDLQRRQLEVLAGAVAASEAVITTAQIPGRPAPILVTEEMVDAMGSGSVIVDAAASTGGNCALTKPGETVHHGGVTIWGPTNLPSMVAGDASRMYARNVVTLLEHVTRAGSVELDTSDEIVDGVAVVLEGEVRHPRARAAAGMEPA